MSPHGDSRALQRIKDADNKRKRRQDSARRAPEGARGSSPQSSGDRARLISLN